MQVISKVVNCMTPSAASLPLDRAMVETIAQMASDRDWLPSTRLTNAVSLQGAFTNSHFYYDGAQPILLTQGNFWRAAIVKWTKDKIAFTPKAPQAATWDEVKAAINGSTSTEVKVALTLGWLVASRLGCILQLNTSDLHWKPNGQLWIIYRRGKSVLARKTAYTVPCTPSEEQRAIIEAHMATRPGPLFTETTGTMLKEALRTANPNLEQRSIRRGSLQLMSKTVPEEILLQISGHTNLTMLRLYLNYGLESHLRMDQVAKATAGVMDGHASDNEDEPATSPPPPPTTQARRRGPRTRT